MIYEFDSRIRYSEVDAGGELTWLALMDYFQDCSVFHSEEKGLGVTYLMENHIAWVLSSWQICLNRMPHLGDCVTVQTWAYGMKSFYGYRNFSLNDRQGERLAFANSIWVLMDTESGRPVKVPKEMAEQYGLEPQLPMNCSGRRIDIPDDYVQYEGMIVPQYFIDTNRHMNNSRYVQVALQYVPEKFRVSEIRVDYRKAAKRSDLLVPRVTEGEDRIIVVFVSEDGSPYAVIEFIHALAEIERCL